MTSETRPPARGRASTETALVAVFAALAAALGYLLAAIPNVELITLAVFVSGTMLGRWRGAVTGVVAAAIYYGLNPYGSSLALPPLYAAQISSLAIVGLAGGITAPLWLRPARVGGPWLTGFLGGACGLLVTAVFQALLIAGLAVSMPDPGVVGFRAALAAGAPFSLVHMAWNAVAFAFLLPVVPRRLSRALSRRLAR